MNWLGVGGLFLLGLFLSAFFSGSETGFYRVTRVRLLFDARSGDWVARLLLALTNHPALFVATTLVGNNVANYLTSMAIVMGAAALPFAPRSAELIAPILLTPLVFVYGELLPKNLFFMAPNRLLRRGGVLFLTFAVLFAPITAILWALGGLLGWVMGEAPLRVQLSLARKELQEVLQEGHDAGILQPAQQRLAQNLFGVASRPASQFCVQESRVLAARLGDPIQPFLQQAGRRGVTAAPIADPTTSDWVGYVRVVDLYLTNRDKIDEVRPLPEISHRDSHLEALMRLQSQGEELARVVDGEGSTIGLLFAEELTTPLLAE